MRIVVIGSGNGGAASVVELMQAGHEVVLFGRSEATLAPYRRCGIGYCGVLGEGRFVPQGMSSDLAECIRNAEAAVVALPVTAHREVALNLARAGWGGERPIILNPGHTGGIFEFATAFASASGNPPPLAEFSTLAYVARKTLPDVVNITGRANRLRVAALPADGAALDLACRLFPGAYDTGDVLASGLCNVNMVVHTPCAVLAAAWVEATGGNFRFYVEGMTRGVVSVMRELDRERMRVAETFGHRLPSIIGEMKAIGTVPASASDDDYEAIAYGEANAAIMAPDSLAHRYYVEDFGHGLVPFISLASIAGVATPVADSLITLCRAAMGQGWERLKVRDTAAMGLTGMTRQDLQRHATVRNTATGV